jgi:FtsZ-binding cell division protein ZapB
MATTSAKGAAGETEAQTTESGSAEARQRPDGFSGDGQEMVIDADSGISAEEQREILVQINGIAERNRLALSSGTETGDGSTTKDGFKAKKNGGFFPAMVNIFAAAVLAGGFFALHELQGSVDVAAREGAHVFNSGERALIEEIRRETGALLDKKDAEIKSILASLGDVESQMSSLIHGNEALSAEQLAMIDNLRSQQAEYLATLETAREERSVILNDARAREASLQAQFEARTSELTDAANRQTEELDAARGELDQLSREQTQASTVGDQITAFFVNANRQITDGNFSGAEETIASLGAVLAGPARVAFRTAPGRRELYVQAADSLQSLMEETRRMSMAANAQTPPPDREAETRSQMEIDRLESELAGTKETMGAEAAATAAQLSGTIATLRSEITGLQSANVSLQTMNTNLQTTNSNLQSANDSLTIQINTLQGNLAQSSAGSTQQVQQIQQLQSTISLHEQTILNLQNENSGLNQQLLQIRQVLQDLMSSQ